MKQPLIETLLLEEVERFLHALPDDAILYKQSPFVVYAAKGNVLRAIMPWLGVEREKAFRLAGMGTGKACDLDETDDESIQLVIWDAKARQLVGACRLLLMTSRENSTEHSYLSTLYDIEFQTILNHGGIVEVSRIFISETYQHIFSAMLLVFKGINRIILANEGIRYLIGVASVATEEYAPKVMDEMMYYFQCKRYQHHEIASLVQPHHDYLYRTPLREQDRALIARCKTLSEFEHLMLREKKMPFKAKPLLRYYEKVGAICFGGSVDPLFSSCIDIFIFWDAAKATQQHIKLTTFTKEECQQLQARYACKTSSFAIDSMSHLVPERN